MDEAARKKRQAAASAMTALEREAGEYQRQLEEHYEQVRANEILDTNGGWGWQ